MKPVVERISSARIAQAIPNVVGHVSLALGAALLAVACGGQASQPAPAVAPAPAPSPMASASAPTPVAAPAPAPTTTATAEAPPAPPRRHHRGIAAALFEGLASIDLKPEQKPVVEGIESDLSKIEEADKADAGTLRSDIADGIAAGKIDHKKTDADIQALVKTATAGVPGVQDAINRLHKTLDATQRKALMDAMRSKHHDAGEGMSDEHEHMGDDEHAGDHEHMGRMGEFAKDLDLTPEQREKLRTKLQAEMKNRQAAMKAKMAANEKRMKSMADAFVGDKFDAKAAGVGTQAPTAVKEMATERRAFLEMILPVLTPDQRAKLASHLKEHATDPD